MGVDVKGAVPLGDLVSLQRGITYKSPLLGRPGPVLLGLASIKPNGGFRRDSLRTYGGSSPEKLLLGPGDVYVSLKDVTQSGDLLGAVSRVPPDIVQGRVTQDTCKLNFLNADYPKDYIYWILRTPEYRKYCRARATGTTNLGLPRDDFLNFPIPQFSSDRQMLIKLLEAFDDKIELNRRMDRTLEDLAATLFRSWFVNFDPVVSKTAGRKPANLDPTLCMLFPSHFQDSELGPIPRGWRARPVSEVVEFNPIRRLAKGAVAPYLDMQNMPTDSALPRNWAVRPYGSGMRFQNGDTLVARITPCLENGKTAFVNALADDEVGWGSTEYIVMRPRPPLPLEYGYFLARSDDFRSHAIANMTGSSGRQRVATTCFKHFLVVEPPDEVAKAFGNCVAPFMRMMKANLEEARTLAALRETLLPKLLSGELRVKATKLVAAAS
jgi:type I restriction enzyme S subunit